MIKEYFAQNETFRLPPGNPAVVFTEGQVGSLLRVVAVKTARASYDILENLIHRANRLSLTTEPVGSATNKKGSKRRGSSVVTSWGRDHDSSSGGYSDTSGAIRSDEDLGSLNYTYEHSDHEVITAPPLSLPQAAVAERTFIPFSDLSMPIVLVHKRSLPSNKKLFGTDNNSAGIPKVDLPLHHAGVREGEGRSLGLVSS